MKVYKVHCKMILRPGEAPFEIDFNVASNDILKAAEDLKINILKVFPEADILEIYASDILLTNVLYFS